MSEALVIRGEAPPALRPESWAGAASRGLEARREREAIVAQVLKQGPDYNTIPGCGTKPTLLKPGAEKVADSLNLYPDYESVVTVEDWERPLFHYRYRCMLRTRGAGEVVATGIGSCNSKENKYRWRTLEKFCPNCGNATIIKGREEYGGGWLCYKKKGGCGAKFADGDAQIEGQQAGRVENDDVFSQINTIDKMAQKRSLVAAVLNLGFSEQFTQDLEDGVVPTYAGPPPQTLDVQPEPTQAVITIRGRLSVGFAMLAKATGRPEAELVGELGEKKHPRKDEMVRPKSLAQVAKSDDWCSYTWERLRGALLDALSVDDAMLEELMAEEMPF